MKKLFLSPVALAAVLLTGCVNAPIGRSEMMAASSKAEAEGASVQQAVRERREAADKLVIRMPVAYLGGRSIALASDAALPAAFKRSSAFVRPVNAAGASDGYNINQVADLIGKLYGIRVRVRPDVFLPASQLVPGGGGATSIGINSMSAQPATQAQSSTDAQGGQGARPAPIPIVTPPTTLTQTASKSVTNYESTIDFDYTGSLEDYLKRINAKLGVSYEWNAAEQRLEFFRLITRTYTLNTSPQSFQSSSTVSKGTTGTTGSSGGGSGSTGAGGIQGAINGQAQATTSSDSDVWRDVLATLDRMHTQAGKVSAVRGTRTIHVVDTPDVIAEMDRYMTAQNEILDRQVELQVRLLTVTFNQDNQFGANADAVFTRLSNGLKAWSLNLAGAGSLATSTAAKATYSVLNPGSQTNGSQVVVQALQEFGVVTETFSQTVPVRNNKTLPVIDFGTFGYLSATTPAPAGGSGAGGSGVPGLVTSTVTSGTMLLLTPSINSSDSLVLSVGLDKADTPSFDTISTGTGATFQQVQLVRQTGIKFDNEVGMKNGEVFVMLGLAKDNGNTDAQGGLLSFSRNTRSTRQMTVLLITPRVVSGS